MNIAVVIAFLEFVAQEIESTMGPSTAANVAALIEKWLPEIASVFPAAVTQLKAMLYTFKSGGTLSADEVVSLKALIGSMQAQSAAVDAQIAAGG